MSTNGYKHKKKNHIFALQTPRCTWQQIPTHSPLKNYYNLKYKFKCLSFFYFFFELFQCIFYCKKLIYIFSSSWHVGICRQITNFGGTLILEVKSAQIHSLLLFLENSLLHCFSVFLDKLWCFSYVGGQRKSECLWF